MNIRVSWDVTLCLQRFDLSFSIFRMSYSSLTVSFWRWRPHETSKRQETFTPMIGRCWGSVGRKCELVCWGCGGGGFPWAPVLLQWFLKVVQTDGAYVDNLLRSQFAVTWRPVVWQFIRTLPSDLHWPVASILYQTARWKIPWHN